MLRIKALFQPSTQGKFEHSTRKKKVFGFDYDLNAGHMGMVASSREKEHWAIVDISGRYGTDIDALLMILESDSSPL